MLRSCRIHVGTLPNRYLTQGAKVLYCTRKYVRLIANREVFRERGSGEWKLSPDNVQDVRTQTCPFAVLSQVQFMRLAADDGKWGGA